MKNRELRFDKVKVVVLTGQSGAFVRQKHRFCVVKTVLLNVKN